jgi:RecJ-like exonuclease
MFKEIFDATSTIANARNVLIVSHFDADGLASAIILASALRKAKIQYNIKIVDQLDDDNFKQFINEPYDTIIFSDFGSLVSRNHNDIIEKNIIIIDHHELPQKEQNPFVIEVNPHKHNIDGGVEISASGIAYFIATYLNPQNVSLAPLALAGAYGDQQDISKYGDFVGLNKRIADEAIHFGILSPITDFQPAAPSTKVSNAIKDFVDNPEDFLEDIKIINKPMKDLTQEEKTKLALNIMKYTLKNNVLDFEKLFKTDYIINPTALNSLTQFKTVRELTTFLNASGKTYTEFIAINSILNNTLDRNTIDKTIFEYTKTLSMTLQKIQKQKPIKMKWISAYEIDTTERIIGTAITIALKKLIIDPTTIAIGIVESKYKPDYVKISARMIDEFVEKGINIGKILQTITTQVGGTGGGHDVAGGGLIPKEKTHEFIEQLNNTIQTILKNTN